MGNSAVLQEMRLTVPEVTGVGTSCKDIEKNYKNYLTSLRIEPTTHQSQSHNFNHCAICYWLNTMLL